MNLSLDGTGWLLRGFLGDEWHHHGAHRPGLRSPDRWLTAEVPGSVLDTLTRHGLVADPYHGTNSLAAEWVPQRTWVYRRALRSPALAAGQRATLCFDGIDPAGTVYLDGIRLGRHEGMFVPASFEITDAVRDGGEHLLAVVVEPAPAGEPQVGRTDRVRDHRSRMGYGWDFCARLVHQGIWRSVELRVTGAARLADVWARTDVAADLASAEVTVSLRRDGPAAPVTVRLVDPAGATAATATTGDGTAVLPVPRPELWWPNGSGRQPLYRLVASTDGDSREVPVGFRRVEHVRADGAGPDARGYGIVVNGRRTYLRGANWVPVDARFGVPRPAKLAHLLGLARDARVNLLRVWGGGLIESPEFYRLCDRLGLLVWQEFALSSSGVASTPSDDPAYLALLRDEAARIVPARRNHPSLLLWCGGNELQDGDGRPLDESAPALGALAATVRRLDPDRPFLPTSPSGPGLLNHPDTPVQHDVHGPWEHQGLADHYRRYDASRCHLLSEFGVEGMAYRRTIDAVLPAADRRLPTTGSPVWDHLGRWWNNEPLVRRAFGDRLSTLDDLVRASQHLQADGLRYAVEAQRRRAHRSVGVICWQLHEPFPNGWCTALVDHGGTAKPAYHAMLRAYRRRHVAPRLERQAFDGAGTITAGVWAWSDEPTDEPVPVTARFLDLTGRVLAEREFAVALDDDRAVEAGTLAVAAADSGTDVLLLDLRAGPVSNRCLVTRTADLAGLTALPPADVTATARLHGPDTWLVELAHRGGAVAPFLRLLDDRPTDAPGFVAFDDNGIDLLPGESATVRVGWRGVPAGHRRLRLDGWNAGPAGVEPPSSRTDHCGPRGEA